MTKASPPIPIYRQGSNAIGGLDIQRMTYEKGMEYAHVLNKHRDEYYVLMMVWKGHGLMHCDMEDIKITPKSIFFVKPYQVHSGTEISEDADAYFLSIAPFLMPDNYHALFQRLSTAQQSIKIPPTQVRNLFNTADLLMKAFTEDHPHKAPITNSLFHAFIHRVAALFMDSEKKDDPPKNQPSLITQTFKQLVLAHSFSHSPSFFANQLNITPAHLNDCVKMTTGLSVTNFLQEAMLMEAKRHLYYTNQDVKRIAYLLGFDDHAYFSRLFKKLTQETPLSFRNKFREPSN